MVMVYRDKRGVEYESVPLPTNEVTDAVRSMLTSSVNVSSGSRYRSNKGPTESN